jgi:phosphoribosylformimino-5-aminoimidazole carboxamide ribonucleotide (ProFAR) isomerase
VAELTGTTLFTASRILRRWEQAGLIRSERARVILRQPDALRRLADAGAEALVVTQIDVEGLLGGADTEGLAEVLAATDLDVIASGGVGTLADLLALDAVTANGRRLAGAIVGTAIYEGRLDVAEAVTALAAGAAQR